MKIKDICFGLLLVLSSGLSFAAAQEDYGEKLVNLYNQAADQIREGKTIEHLLKKHPVLPFINIRQFLKKNDPKFTNPPTLLKVAVEAEKSNQVEQLINDYGVSVRDVRFDNGLDAFSYLVPNAMTLEGLKIGVCLAKAEEKEIIRKAKIVIAQDLKNRDMNKKKTGRKFYKFFNSLDELEIDMLSNAHPDLIEHRKNVKAERALKVKQRIDLYS